MEQGEKKLYKPGDSVPKRGHYLLVDRTGKEKEYTVFLAPGETFPDTSEELLYRYDPSCTRTTVGGMPSKTQS